MGKRTEQRRRRLISAGCYTDTTGLSPKPGLAAHRVSQGGCSCSALPQPGPGPGHRPYSTALHTLVWLARLGWQLPQQHDNEKLLKRRSFCASIKKRKLILTLQLYSPSITDKIPSDLLQLHKTQLLLWNTCRNICVKKKRANNPPTPRPELTLRINSLCS